MANHLVDRTGQRYGQLTALRRVARTDRTFWVCVCDCDPERELLIRTDVLGRERGAKSCGCLDNPAWFTQQAEIKYLAAHNRVYRVRGIATEHTCVACSGPAKDWALKHEAGDRQVDPDNGLAFSPDPEDYQPMCRSCHARYDRGSAS